MTAPGYPFSARDIFGDLRSKLAAEHRRPMCFERLAKMLGRSKSTTYNWFDIFHHPHVLGFLCLLERLPPAERQSFIEAHCRAYPTLDDPRLAHAPGKTGELLELLNQRTRVVEEIGRAKESAGMPIYEPKREGEVFRNVIEHNTGPLDADAVQRIFERIIDEMRSLQRMRRKHEGDK